MCIAAMLLGSLGPLNFCCCSCRASCWRIAFSRLRSVLSCRRSERVDPHIPTTRRLWIILSLNIPDLRLYIEAMIDYSAVSSSWYQQLNRAHLKIAFLCAWKQKSNFTRTVRMSSVFFRVLTMSHFFLSVFGVVFITSGCNNARHLWWYSSGP